MAERVVVLIVASGASWEPEALRLLGDPSTTTGAPGAGGKPVLRAATVVDAPSQESGFGGTSSRRQLVLAVPEADASAYFAAVAAVENPLITVVRRG